MAPWRQRDGPDDRGREGKSPLGESVNMAAFGVVKARDSVKG
jgi:hypothetical protein